jgi:DNA recombination protein RmuC
VDELRRKDYERLHQINPPDYVLMFVPIENALTVALKHDASIFDEAFNKNIILVSSSTLLATMKTVGYIWKQENQKKNVLEMARLTGTMHDKFVNFVSDIDDIGAKLNAAQKSYDGAKGKLVEGKGNIVATIIKIENLGAKTAKQLSKQLVDDADDDDMLDEQSES